MADVQIDRLREGVQSLDAPLNSVGAVLGALAAACAPVPPKSVSPALAAGAFAAADIVAQAALPRQVIALIDGRALASADLIGASPMSPAILMREPASVRVGQPIPADCDCVIDDALVTGGGGIFEAHGAAAPGEGVRRAGEDVQLGAVLVRAGERISRLAAFALESAGVREITIRNPKVLVAAVPDPEGACGTSMLLSDLAREAGATTDVVRAEGRDVASIADAIAKRGADAIFLVGGTGAGPDDHAVSALRACGRVLAHGLALDPGRTGGAGMIGGAPVVCAPGRFDSAMAVYLSLCLPLICHLADSAPAVAAQAGPLTRKVASAVGLAQVALLRAHERGWEPLCVGDITMTQVLRADAYLIIPEGSEGMAEGAHVEPRRLPGLRSVR